MARKMKDSGIEWIGEIPENWDLRRLKTVIESHSSGVWGKDESNVNSENNIICIRIADFDYPRMTIKKDKEFTKRNYSNSEIKKYKLAKGDILVEKSGGGEKTPVGRSIIWEEDIDALYANFIERLRVFEKAIFPKFLQYILYSFYELGGSNLYFNQTTGIQNLNIKAMLNNLKIPLPKRQAQNKIANFLDEKTSEIEGIKKELEKEIEVLEDYKKSIIYEAVTKGLDKNAEMKDSGVEWIGEIPRDWKVSKIKYLTKTRHQKEKLSKTNIYIGLENIEGWTGKFIKTNSEYEDLFYDFCKEGDLLYSKLRPNLCKVIISPFDACCTGELEIIKECSIGNKCLFYYFLTKELTDLITSSTYGAKMPRANWDFIKNIKITYPHNEYELKEITSFLDEKALEIDTIISDKKEQLQVLDEYKKSMIYEYVTGKKAVE